MINKELVSRVKNTLNILNKDMNVNGRFILHTAQNIAESYIAKRLASRKLFRQDNLYRPIPCVELTKVDSFKCGIVEFKSCKKLMRSKERLPKMVYSKYGSSLKEVTAIDNIYDFKMSTIAQYRRDTNREGTTRYKYFYIRDGYLWIPDSTQEIVELYILSTDLYDLYSISTCEESCDSAWEYDFIVPSDLLEQVISETTQKVAFKYKIPTDENPNMDSNVKSRTV